MGDFDFSVRLMNNSSTGSKSNVILRGFYDYTESPTRSGPWFQIALGTYSVGTDFDYFRMYIYDDDDVQQMYTDFQKWDYSATLGTWYWGRIQKIGNVYRFKHWREGDGEPEGWDTVDTISGLGTFTGPLYAYSRTNSTYCGFDDFELIENPTTSTTTTS